MKHKFLFSVFIIFFIFVFIALGTWQIIRLNWKNNLILEIENSLKNPPVELSQSNKENFLKIKTSGTIDFEKQIYLYNLNDSGTPGFEVVNPIKIGDENYLINRGWIPERLRYRKTRPETLTEGSVVVEGIIREDKKKGYFVPENEPQNDVWLYINAEQMAAKSQVGPISNYYIDVLRGPGPYTLPIGASQSINMRNEHLQYALTWYLLAISLLVIYVIYHYRTDDG